MYYLPLEDLEQRIEAKGERMPKIYKVLLKYITPALVFFLAMLGLINEVKNPTDLPFWGQILALIMFLIPNALWIGFYIIDPWNPEKHDWQKDNIKILKLGTEKS